MIAPAGTPISLSDLFGWMLDVVSGRNRQTELCSAVKAKYGVQHCFVMSSGRAAMAMIFRLLKQHNTDERRQEIVLPSYTCYSVPAAAEIAGLKVRICDIDPNTMSYDRDQLASIDLSKVLCLVSANLYGYPNDLPHIEALCKDAGCYFLDDAAQSMNAVIAGRYAGSFGDLGLYSLDKGKNITSIQGGIIVTNNDTLAELISAEIDCLPEPGFKAKLADSIKLIIYAFLLKPYLYWIPARIPALGLGKTIYTTDYVYTRLSRPMCAMAARLFKRIDRISEQRTRRTQGILEAISGNQHLDTPGILNKDVTPVYLRTPIYVLEDHRRKALIDALFDRGIIATCSYPQSIADLDQVLKYSVIHNDTATGGRYMAQHIVTLPSIAYINSHDIQAIRSAFAELEE